MSSSVDAVWRRPSTSTLRVLVKAPGTKAVPVFYPYSETTDRILMLGSIVGGPIHLVPLTPNTGERLILVFNTNALRDNAAPLNLILPHVSDGVQIPGTVCVITPNTSGHFVSLTDEQCRRGIALLSEFAQP